MRSGTKRRSDIMNTRRNGGCVDPPRRMQVRDTLCGNATGVWVLEEREVFLFLLECEDDKLWRWFMGYEACPHAHAVPLMQKILALKA